MEIVLLGDACRPGTSCMPEGAAIAVDNAAILARWLEEIEGESGFRRYESHRKPRTSEAPANLPLPPPELDAAAVL